MEKFNNNEKEALSIEEWAKQPFEWRVCQSRESTVHPETWLFYTLEDATESTQWDINKLWDNLTFFFKWVEKKSYEMWLKESWTVFRRSLKFFEEWDIKRAVWTFLWWVMNIFVDSGKTNNSFGDPWNMIDWNEYSSNDLNWLYFKLINESVDYRSNPRNMVNNISAASRSLDESIDIAKYDSALSYLIDEWKLNPWDAMLVHTPDQTMQSELFTWAIHSYDDTPYTHVIVIETIISHNPPNFTFIHSNWTHGVHSSSWSDYTPQWPIDFMVMDTPCESEKWVLDFASSKVNAPYDTMWLWKDLLKGERSDSWNNSYYCSELYLEALESTWVNVSLSLISPADIMQVTKPVYSWIIG